MRQNRTQSPATTATATSPATTTPISPDLDDILDGLDLGLAAPTAPPKTSPHPKSPQSKKRRKGSGIFAKSRKGAFKELNVEQYERKLAALDIRNLTPQQNLVRTGEGGIEITSTRKTRSPRTNREWVHLAANPHLPWEVREAIRDSQKEFFTEQYRARFLQNLLVA